MIDSPHNPDLQRKINQACLVIEKALDRYKRPCIMSSFGKDSVLILHMVREWFTKDIDVVFFKQPWFPRKYSYADRLATEWELTIHTDIAPRAMSLMSTETKGTEIVSHYAMGQQTMAIIMGKQGIAGRPKWLCGRDDVLRRPAGNVGWPWDVAFHGHKASDVDAGAGPIPIEVDIHQMTNSCDLAYPLRSFTDADVWECFEKWGLPVNSLRYKKEESEWTEDTESIFNPDYQPYCADCLDRRKGGAVLCPKNGLAVSNISGSIAHFDPAQLGYLGAKS